MHVLVRVAFVASLAATAFAQAPSPWVEQSLAGAPIAPTVSAEGKLVLCRGGSWLRVFSAVTNRWHEVALSFGTSPVLRKDMLLVPESDRWTAFSAYRGKFDVLMVNYATSSMEAGDSLARVLSGNQLHVFSAFTGQWHTRTIPATNVLIRLEARLATVQTLFGAPVPFFAVFDGYTGQWHDTALPASGSIGSAAIFGTNQQQAGFSPLRGGWTQMPVTLTSWPPASNTNFDGNLRASRGSVFSALTGTFATLPQPLDPFNPGGITLNTNSGHASVNGQNYVLAASRNTWVPVPAGATSFGSYDFVSWARTASDIHAYDPVQDVFVSTPWTGPNPGGMGTTVDATDPATGAQRIFSVLTGQWYTPPAGVTGAFPWRGPTSALYVDAAGLVAFDARTGNFVPLAGAGLTRHSGHVATNATHLHVFDVNTAQWLSQPMQLSLGIGPLLGQRVVLAASQGTAVAYGVRGGRLASKVLAEPLVEIAADDDVGYVRTANTVYAFSGLADVTPWQDAPDGHYGAAIGTRSDMQADIPAGQIAVLGFGPPLPAAVPVPPYGDLWLDLPGTLLFVMLPAPGETRALLTLPIPEDPVLRGTLWVQQIFMLAPTGDWLGAPSRMLLQ